MIRKIFEKGAACVRYVSFCNEKNGACPDSRTGAEFWGGAPRFASIVLWKIWHHSRRAAAILDFIAFAPPLARQPAKSAMILYFYGVRFAPCAATGEIAHDTIRTLCPWYHKNTKSEPLAFGFCVLSGSDTIDAAFSKMGPIQKCQKSISCDRIDPTADFTRIVSFAVGLIPHQSIVHSAAPGICQL